MSILIKGMEMPTRCCDCKMYVEDIYYCPLLHREIENPWADDGVELDCPLVLVPPHGRLIDADTIGLTNFEIMLCKQEHEPYKEALKMVLDKIEKSPTIILEDRREAEE